jgi:hypothetical protein
LAGSPSRIKEVRISIEIPPTQAGLRANFVAHKAARPLDGLACDSLTCVRIMRHGSDGWRMRCPPCCAGVRYRTPCGSGKYSHGSLRSKSSSCLPSTERATACNNLPGNGAFIGPPWQAICDLRACPFVVEAFRQTVRWKPCDCTARAGPASASVNDIAAMRRPCGRHSSRQA